METEADVSILESGLADQQLTAIATSVGALIREHYGRDSIKVKAWAVDDMIVVVIRGHCFTALEKAMIDGGEPQGVIALRADFDSIMADRYKQRNQRGDGPHGAGAALAVARRPRHHGADSVSRQTPASTSRRGDCSNGTGALSA